ncbi:Androgen-dependent TFPI-regulating protein [Frankliniella fusca]|uniref:Androgen-dependent TFPI-regulating protein n=1 Tax=Frankliniella fusca TaxID=407009 RepID=A0AAE1HXF3_9NEOP|nr:Androgen-dependent TFPI-regulating protein [Frankliniella fusca]
MRSSTLFTAVAHCTTVYYYAHVLRFIAGMRPTGDETILRNFIDFRPKFLTMWGLAAQALLFVLCVLHDVTRVFPPSSPVRRAARALRDLVLVGVSAPIAVTVTAIFWGLFALDRELVMPAALDKVVPLWLNHAMHTFVLVLVVVQLLAEPHHPPPLGQALALALAVCGAYLYTLLNEFATTGRWIYPVFEILDWPGRTALLAFTFLLHVTMVVVVRAAVLAMWGHAKSTSRGGKKRKD